jgi:photosystem II stability/assembly factor-like uncharacterized protein
VVAEEGTGARPDEPSRPDDEPIINEGGLGGFAIDGTDSFAVPGPADGLPPEDVDAAVRLAARRRLLITLGAALAVLAGVIAVGRAGGAGDAGSVRSEDQPAFTLPSPFGEGEDGGDEVTAVDPTIEDRGWLQLERDATTTDSFEVDDEEIDGTVPTTTDPFDDQFDQFDDPSFPDLPDFTARTLPRVTPGRIVPPTTRPRTTTPALTTPSNTTSPTTTTADTTSATTTSTTATTSTSTSTTTTTPAPAAAAWQAPATALGIACSDNVRLFAGRQSLLAAVGSARVLRSTDAGANWTAVTNVGLPTAYADDPTDSTRAWIGSAAGVFRLGAPGATEVGDLSNVTALSVATSSGTTTLLALSDGTLHRSVDDGATWAPAVGSLPAGAVPGELLALDTQRFFVGTSQGVFRSLDGGATLTPVSSEPVVGAPVRDGTNGTNISWLRANGGGVVRSTDDGVTWTAPAATGSPIATGATSLAVVPNIGLVTAGASANLIASADGGVTWAPITDQPPYRPTGVVRAASGTATVIWSTDCAGGTDPTASHSVLRRADG